MQGDFFSFIQSAETVWSVGELNRHVRALLEQDYRLQDLWLEGEVSNFTRAASGHVYFTLKDDGAQVHCVMWRTAAQAARVLPRHGELIQAHGAISVYEAQGRYQFYVDAWRPAGRGDLHRQLELLKARLAEEGLFDEERKRPLVRVPRRIGIVTSLNTAALRDILNVLRRRWPLVEVVVAHCAVQGDGAPPQICAAIRALERYAEIDTLIVARGGGSLEELWAFNDEGVARAIAACKVPVISGVGHEIDFTLADFVADLRAPTPSAAAELAVPDRGEYRAALGGLLGRMDEVLRERLSGARYELSAQTRALRLLSPQAQLVESRQRVDDLVARARVALRGRLALARARVTGTAGRLNVLGPATTLARGYAIVRDAEGRIVRTAAQVAPGAALRVQLSDGEFAARREEA